MVSATNFFESVKKHPDRFYIVHYSSQSLFDGDAGAYAPRITSVVVRHYQSGQTVSFSMHTVAEYLKVPWEDIEDRYDDIERELLTQFYDFARDRREKFWVHWNMRNVTFGFEHLEHRYRVLIGKEPPSIPVEVRLNLNDILKHRYGDDYAPDPRMPSLMDLNGGRVQGFLSGKDGVRSLQSQGLHTDEYLYDRKSWLFQPRYFSISER